MKRELVYAALGALASLGVVSKADASAFAVHEDSAENVGTVYSGTASEADDPSTAYDNPAGMTELNGFQISGGGVLAFPTVDFQGSLKTTPGLGSAPLAGNNGNNGGRAGLIPSFYAVFPLGDRLRAGMAVNAPFGLTIKNNGGWFGRYDATDGAVLSTNLNPSLAYKISDKLSIGGGLDWQWFNAAFSQSVFTGGADADARFEGHDWGFGYNAGVLYKPMDGTRVGLAYRSKINETLKGGLDFSGTPIGLGDQPAHADWANPASTTVSVTQTITPKWSASLGLQYTQWSSFKSVVVTGTTFTEPVNFQFHDTWMVSLGGTYQLTDAWKLRGGLGWDQSPVDNQYRTVSIPDQDRYMVGLGAGYKFNDRLSMDGSYAHYFATHASMNSSVNATDFPGNTVLSGIYQVSLDYVALSVRYKF
jgi:long-chain fatty acid transport protein